MQLIGMLDSPFVRRTAISLDLLGLPFEHKPVSVFSTFAQFQAINPVVKAPTLVCHDGGVLMDSTLILEYAEALAQPKTLVPRDIKARQRDLQLTGLALAACEKAVQIIYEHNLRPPEKHHAPWLTRVRGQLLAAFRGLENEIARLPPTLAPNAITQSTVTSAVSWHFTQKMLPEIVIATEYPALMALSAAAEKLPSFAAYPHSGPGVQRN